MDLLVIIENPRFVVAQNIDKHWQSWLESNGKSDNLYIILSCGN
jgi:hypothetical protein